MVEILGFTNDLSVALQKRDQDLLNALSLVNALPNDSLQSKLAHQTSRLQTVVFYHVLLLCAPPAKC